MVTNFLIGYVFLSDSDHLGWDYMNLIWLLSIHYHVDDARVNLVG